MRSNKKALHTPCLSASVEVEVKVALNSSILTAETGDKQYNYTVHTNIILDKSFNQFTHYLSGTKTYPVSSMLMPKYPMSPASINSVWSNSLSNENIKPNQISRFHVYLKSYSSELSPGFLF